MKQEKKSKRNFTQNIDVSKELERWIDYTIGELKNDYLIEIIIERKNEFIERIANSTPEEIKEIVQVTGAVINHLGGDTKVRVPKSGTHRVSIDFLYLLTAALSDDKRIRIPVPKDVLPPDILAICYRIIQTQAIVRYDLYIRKNPTVRNVFIARYLEIVEQDPIARPYGEKALEELSKPARGLFERKIKNIDIKERGEPDRGREFWQFVHEASLEAFPLSLEENFIAAVKEDKNEKARKVPLRAYQKVADHELPGYTRLRKIKERLRKQGKSKEEIERRIGEEIKLTNPVSLEELLEEKGFEVVEFVDKDTTRTGCDVEFAEKDDTRERIKIAIVEYINGLAPQAEPQKVVGKFLLEKLNLGEIEDYVKETKERFRIDTQKVHKASGISLRTVERFYEGLMKFYRQKKLR